MDMRPNLKVFWGDGDIKSPRERTWTDRELDRLLGIKSQMELICGAIGHIRKIGKDILSQERHRFNDGLVSRSLKSRDRWLNTLFYELDACDDDTYRFIN
jgi:hypothetical protein